jgi:hypothetical protein
MSRKPRSPENPEENWQIVLEGLKNGSAAESCSDRGIRKLLPRNQSRLSPRGIRSDLLCQHLLPHCMLPLKLERAYCGEITKVNDAESMCSFLPGIQAQPR